MENREKYFEQEDLAEIEVELKALALRVSDILLAYRNRGIIDDDEYERMVRIKQEFINSR